LSGAKAFTRGKPRGVLGMTESFGSDFSKATKPTTSSRPLNCGEPWNTSGIIVSETRARITPLRTPQPFPGPAAWCLEHRPNNRVAKPIIKAIPIQRSTRSARTILLGAFRRCSIGLPDVRQEERRDRP
jgi:hypothetical protein